MTEKKRIIPRSRAGHIQVGVLVLIRLAFFIGLVLSLWQRNFETAGIVMIGLVLSFLPQLLQRSFRVRLPLTYELIILLFIFASVFMGEVNSAYDQFWWWDIVLHTSSGVILGYVGFLIMYSLYLKHELKAAAGIVAFFTFSVAMMSAAIWEIFEFSMDMLLGTVMQKGLTDTMTDHIVAALGSLLAAGVAYWHIKQPDTSPLSRTVKRFFSLNPQLTGEKNR